MLRIARLLAATHSGVLPLLLAALTFASWRSRTRSVVTPSLAASIGTRGRLEQELDDGSVIGDVRSGVQGSGASVVLGFEQGVGLDELLNDVKVAHGRRGLERQHA